MDERDQKAMNEELNQPSCLGAVSGSFIGIEYLEGIEMSNDFTVDGVVIGKPFNLQMVVSRFGKEIIPNCLGIYHLFYKDQLIYIGMSKKHKRSIIATLKRQRYAFQ